MEPVIAFRDVSFRYPESEQWALKRVNLSLYPGQWVSILGGNGSGKSTLARLMNGLLLPTEGEVKVFGKDPRREEDLWLIRQKAGMVFQNPENQIVALTVEDDIAFGLENLGIPPEEMEARIERVLKQMRLDSVRKQEPHRLSGGQKQRLAIAGVLAMQPEVIIFDEATSMLDPQGARDVCQVMQELHRAGMTVIHITHEVEEVLRCERVLILHRGEIRMDGSPREILKESGKLESFGLLPPFAVRIREALARQGIKIPGWPITEEELVEALWRYSSIT